jgi:hypothetical protein
MKYPDFSEAACTGIGVELFFEESKTPTIEEKMVMRLCRSCPVQKDCLEWGLRHESYGIWGGLTRAELRRMRAARNILLVPIMASDYL